MPSIVIPEEPLTPTQALEIKRVLDSITVKFSEAKSAIQISLAMEAIIQGRHLVITHEEYESMKCACSLNDINQRE